MSKIKSKMVLDADGLPVRAICEKLAARYDMKLLIVKNIHHEIYSDYGQVITVGDLADEVDHEIVKHTCQGDLIVTQDYGLASLVLGAKAHAIHPNGFFYTLDNIDQLLFERHMNARERKAGIRSKPIKKRTKALDEAFEKALESYLVSIKD